MHFALFIFVGNNKLFYILGGKQRQSRGSRCNNTFYLLPSLLSPPEIGLKTPSPQSAVAAPDGSALGRNSNKLSVVLTLIETRPRHLPARLNQPPG